MWWFSFNCLQVVDLLRLRFHCQVFNLVFLYCLIGDKSSTCWALQSKNLFPNRCTISASALSLKTSVTCCSKIPRHWPLDPQGLSLPHAPQQARSCKVEDKEILLIITLLISAQLWERLAFTHCNLQALFDSWGPCPLITPHCMRTVVLWFIRSWSYSPIMNKT